VLEVGRAFGGYHSAELFGLIGSEDEGVVLEAIRRGSAQVSGAYRRWQN